MWLYFHCGPEKTFVRADMNQQKHTHTFIKLNLIRSHVSIMIAVTVIILSLITNIKIAMIIALLKTIIIIIITVITMQ